MDNYICNEDFLQHEGVLERSGRYPWGSGEHPFQRLGGLYGEYKKAKAKGCSDKEIAEMFKNEDGTVTSLISKDEFYSAKSKQIVEDSYSGSLPAFVAAFISNKKLTAKEADEIQKMIDEFKQN
jgi:hypothetical protein